MDNTTPSPCRPIDTNGWDSVYAIRYPDVNNAIIRKRSSPTSFSSLITGDDGQQRMNGTFSDWQLITGGDGRNLFMNLPIPTATFEFSGVTDTMTNISAVAEINLEWLSTGNQQNLVPQNSVGSVGLRRINFGTTSISNSPLRQSIFQSQLEKWLQNNILAFRHTFAELEIDTVADTGNFAWLKPKGFASYAIVDAGDGEDITQSIFAVLAMNSHDPIPGTHEVSPYAIPTGSNSALLLHPKRVIENMFRPYVHFIFDNATPEDFDIDNGGLSITNNKQLSFGPQSIDATKVITPMIDEGNFKLTLKNCKVVIELTAMSFEWSPGITVEINHTTEAAIGMTSSKQLKLNITNSSTNANVSTSTIVLIAEIVGPILGAIVGGIIGGVIGGAAETGEVAINAAGNAAEQGIEMSATAAAADSTNVTSEASLEASFETSSVSLPRLVPSSFKTFFARPLVKIFAGVFVSTLIGAVPTMIVEILKEVADNQGKNLPTLDTFGKEAIGSITWPNTVPDGFTLNSIELSGSLCLGINLQFA